MYCYFIISFILNIYFPLWYATVLFTGWYQSNGKRNSEIGHALPMYDYTEFSKTVRFKAGVSSVTEKIVIIDDDEKEDLERFWVGLREPIGGKLGNIERADVIVQDDEGTLIRISRFLTWG